MKAEIKTLGPDLLRLSPTDLRAQATTGQLSLQGCNTASVNDNFCSGQGVTTLGQVGYAYFSESATKYIEIDKKGQGTSTTVYLNSYNRGRNSWFGNGNVVPPEVVKP